MKPIFLFVIFNAGLIFDVSAELREIKLDSSRTQVSVDVRDTKTFSFYAVTKGNSSSTLSISSSLPKGAALRVRETILDKPLNRQLLDARSFWKLPVRNEAEVARDNSTCVSFSPGESSPETDDVPDIARPESNDPLCDLFSEQDMVAIGEALAATYGGSWNRSQVCGYLMNSYMGGAEPCDPAKDPICTLLQSLDEPKLKLQLVSFPKAQLLSSNQVQRFSTLIQKNACGPKSTRYLVIIDVDLSKVSVVDNPTATLVIQATEYEYAGDRAASIKPTSSGKYAPQPILLMSFLGSFCGQKLNLTPWATNHPRSTTALKVADLIPYSGRILTRTPIGRVLRGGKASFDLYSSSSAYGVCFNLVAKRQRVNGY